MNIYWKDVLVGSLMGDIVFDFPWSCSKVKLMDNINPALIEFLQWLDRESKTEDGVNTDPPFPEEYSQYWYLEKIWVK